jgi:hypothetical protein
MYIRLKSFLKNNRNCTTEIDKVEEAGLGMVEYISVTLILRTFSTSCKMVVFS